MQNGILIFLHAEVLFEFETKENKHLNSQIRIKLNHKYITKHIKLFVYIFVAKFNSSLSHLSIFLFLAIFINSFLIFGLVVLWIFITATKHDAGKWSYFYQFCSFTRTTVLAI